MSQNAKIGATYPASNRLSTMYAAIAERADIKEKAKYREVHACDLMPGNYIVELRTLRRVHKNATHETVRETVLSGIVTKVKPRLYSELGHVVELHIAHNGNTAVIMLRPSRKVTILNNF